jgi:hypothetical protein
MIGFSDLEHLSRALHEGRVPSAVRRAAALAHRESGGRLWVEPGVPVPVEAQVSLEQAGAVFATASPEPPAEPIACWHQLLPLRCERSFPDLSPDTPILFELSDPRHWPSLAAELRCLGRVVTSFCWSAESDHTPLLIRATGAPWYSLFRSPPTEAASAPWRCYTEQVPRVWVELGYRQPLADDVVPPPGRLLLIRAPHCWRSVEDGPFQADLPELSLPDVPASSTSARVERACPIRLRLARHEKTEAAELWVLRDQPLQQLRRLVEELDDERVGRLQVAVAQKEGREIVVLWAALPRRSPPVIEVPGVAFHAHLKLPNLFLPCGHRLYPPLRRDAVRQLLADDAAEIVWLHPCVEGGFRRESLPSAVFRPLREIVAYVVPRPARRLTAWELVDPFEGERFAVAPEDSLVVLRLRPAAMAGTSRPRMLSKLRDWWDRVRPVTTPSEAAPPVPSARSAEVPHIAAVAAAARDRVTETVHGVLHAAAARSPTGPQPTAAGTKPKLLALEERFINLVGPLDAPGRLALLPELAGTYLRDAPSDAAVCWMNALWETEAPPALWWWGWFQAEAQAASHWLDVEAAVQRTLKAAQPEAADVRAVAAFCAWTTWGDASAESPAMAAAGHRTCIAAPPERLRSFLEKHEAVLPYRAAWLAWAGLSREAGGDVLSLARARDRLLERLYRKGVNPERDLPSFLRFGGRPSPQRVPSVAAWLLKQRGEIDRWIERMQNAQPRDPIQETPPILVTESYVGKTPPFRPLPYGPAGEALLTKAYADLVLAWGMARLGATAACAALVEQARQVLDQRDPVHTFLFKAFLFRTEQGLDGKPDGPLPAPLLAEWQQLGTEQQRYQVDLLRRQSRILEPSERIDPYHGQVQQHYYGELGRQLAALSEIHDRNELAEQLHELFREATQSSAARSAQARVLTAALELAPRVGEAFAADLLGHVGPVLDMLTDVREQAALLERAVFVAAHFDQAVPVEALVARFEQMLDARRGPDAAAAFESLAAQSFRGLRKLGRISALERLLKEMSDCLLQGQTLATLRGRYGSGRAQLLRSLLHVANGWFYVGAEVEATEILDDARHLLLQERKLEPKEQGALARAYAATLGHAPLGLALDRIEELFKNLERIHDLFRARSTFSLAQLDVIETVVIAVASDEFALGASVRRWLDEDEYLVRRRIQRDLRALL